MPPIFKNALIKECDIGEYMRKYLKETGLKFKDRRNLIGSMFGIKMLFITPLLKWYLEQGLEITKVYQVVQFNPVKCFAGFAKRVSDDRRAGTSITASWVITHPIRDLNIQSPRLLCVLLL